MYGLDHDLCYRAVLARDRRFDGRFYTAVRTTGIYCRPICPAPTPRPQNVQFYPSAAAAQAAGYRPCLRCRPERAPAEAEIAGRPELLRRALRLIELGWLDGASVAALAQRMQTSERQLRRLFQQHLGAAPVQIAQNRRLLLAKQLVQDSRLSMAEIAHAAGFGSLRRFNEAFRAAHGVPPRQWRRQGSAGSDAPAAAADDGLLLRLHARSALHWPALCRHFAARAVDAIERVEGGCIVRALNFDGVPMLLQLQPGGRNELLLRVHSVRLTALPALLARVRQVFDLGADGHAIHAALALDPQLAGLLDPQASLRVPGAWGGFELAARAVLGQQVSMLAARRLLALLVEHLGAPLPTQLAQRSGLSRLFPTPQQVAASTLEFMPMPQSRRTCLRSLAAAVRDQPALLQPGASLETSLAALQALPGIGPWTAHYIALRELREPDAFPCSDAGLLRSWQVLDGTRPSPQQLEQRAQPWRPWRGYAAQLLWDRLATLESG